MLAMIRHGVKEVFTDIQTTDVDIDDIIKQGEAKVCLH